MSQVRLPASRKWVALVAAYVLVLQAFFVGLAGIASASSSDFDHLLAASLCAPGEGGPGAADSDRSAAAHADQSCCTAGCPMLSGGEPARAGYERVAHRPADLIAFVRRLDTPVGFVAGRSPANPRAPPLA